MLARRKNLQALEYSDHAGLAFQKLYRQHDEKGESAKELLNAISELKVSSQVYKTAFARWQNQLPEKKLLLTATTNSALAIGLGNPSPIEVGFSLHQTYGTPYLLGSAIKGLLTRAADAHGLSQEVKNILFGTTESAAHITYWDAMLEPNSPQPFQQDVITVHHQKYYQGNGYPTDFDDPNPVAFLSIKSGIKFCVAISSNSQGAEQWLYLAAELLKYAFEKMGLGGKTNSGYGYFNVQLPEKEKSVIEQAQELLETKRAVILQIKGAQDLTKADPIITDLESVKPEIRRLALEFLLKHLKSIKQWNLEKSRCQKIQTMLEES
jgi:CRISPR-associated protein Cmr6